MGSTYIFGRQVTTTDVGYGIVGGNRQRFYTPNALTTTIIAYRMGFYGGRDYYDGSSVNPSVRLAVARATSGGTPDDLLAVTGIIVPTSDMSYGGDGTYLEAALEAPVLMTPGTYSLGLATSSPGVAHGMVSAASISATNENFYDKSGLAAGTRPTDPVGGSASNQGHMSVCLVGITNTAPAKPSSLSPSGNQVDGDFTPQMQATFSDAEITLPGGVAWDYVASARIQVQTLNGATTLWDHTYTPSATERNNKRTNITYAGSALSAGVTYRWRILHSDRAGASTWSDWVTFDINPGGSVGVPTAPTGKQLTLTPAGVTAKWTHAGSLAMNAARARLYKDGVLQKTSGLVPKTAANGATFTLTWAELGFGSLAYGESYSVEVQGRDTGSVLSPYSGQKAFTVNARPTTPTNLSPSNGSTVTARPLLSGRTSDPDNTAAQLTMTVEITRADTTKVTKTAPYTSGTTYAYQTTSTDLPAEQTFSYRMQSSDGTFTSEWSSPTTVIYGSGPSVTITGPLDGAVLTTSSPLILWSTTGQVSRRVEIWGTDDAGNSILVHNSGNETTSSNSYQVPAGILRNGKSYGVKVFVTNAVPLQGVSQVSSFSLAFVPPDAITGLAAYPIQIGSDRDPSAIQLDWDLTVYPQSQFIGYDVFRRALSGPYEPGEEQIVWLRRITSPLQTSFVDYHARSGVSWEYIVTQSIQQDLDVTSSVDATAQAQINLGDVVLVSAFSPTVYRSVLRYLAASGEGMSYDLKQDQRQAIPVGARAGRTVRGAYQAWEMSGRFSMVTDNQMTADQRIKELRDAVVNGKTFSLRDHKNRKRWVTIVGYREQERGHYYEVDLQFREEDFEEGEDPSTLIGPT